GNDGTTRSSHRGARVFEKSSASAIYSTVIAGYLLWVRVSAIGPTSINIDRVIVAAYATHPREIDDGLRAHGRLPQQMRFDADLAPPVRALAVCAGNIDRGVFFGEVIRLNQHERRLRCADKAMNRNWDCSAIRRRGIDNR